MVNFEVNDMTCGHCVSAIRAAVQAVDPGATVAIDIASHRVTIDSDQANGVALRDAIQSAGYTPLALSEAVDSPAASVPRRGCCCG